MLHTLWKKILLTAVVTALPCAALAMPVTGAHINVPKPGRIGSSMPRPTVPVGNYQNPGKIPAPMARTVPAPQAIRPIPVPRAVTPVPSSLNTPMLPREVGLSAQASLFVYKPQLHLYSWQMPAVGLGYPGFQALARNPQLSAAWWKPLPLWNQGDRLNFILPRLTEEIK